MPLASCMGGWCSRREACLHYREGTTQPPAERLCPSYIERPLLLVRKPDAAQRATTEPEPA